MRSSVKVLLLAGFALALVLVAGQTGKAQALKIGFIDDDKIKENFPAWVRAQEQWEVERKAWEDEANNKQTELQDMMDEYDKQKLILSDEKKKEREAAIRVKRESLDAFTRQVYGPGGTAEQKQMTLIGPLLDRVNQAIGMVAEEENFDVVFTMQSGLGYIKPIYDITDKVLEKLESLEG
jgi:outer membrane protein